MNSCLKSTRLTTFTGEYSLVQRLISSSPLKYVLTLSLAIHKVSTMIGTSWAWPFLWESYLIDHLVAVVLSWSCRSSLWWFPGLHWSKPKLSYSPSSWGNNSLISLIKTIKLGSIKYFQDWECTICHNSSTSCIKGGY